jgi:hypothetical protein
MINIEVIVIKDIYINSQLYDFFDFLDSLLVLSIYLEPSYAFLCGLVNDLSWDFRELCLVGLTFNMKGERSFVPPEPQLLV